MSGYLTPYSSTIALNLITGSPAPWSGTRSVYAGLALAVPPGPNATLANITEVTTAGYNRGLTTWGGASTPNANTTPVLTQNSNQIDIGPVTADMTTAAPFGFLTDTPSYNGALTATTLTAGAASAGGTFAAATYYWVVTAVNAQGEGPISNEVNKVLTANQQEALSWTAVTGATSYNVYRATAPGAENTLVANVTTTSYSDTGTSLSTKSPSTQTGVIAAPVLTNPPTASSGGGFAAGTYYWTVTAVNANGETNASNEATIAAGVTANQQVTLTWAAVAGAVSYNIYRGTQSGGENVLVNNVTTTTFADTGAVGTAQTPPAKNTAANGNILYVWNLVSPVQALNGKPIRIPIQGLTIQ